MPGAVATTAHLATIVIANLAHLATEASRHIAANMGGHGIPGGERRNGIHAVTTSSTGTGNNAGIAGITHRDGAIIREGTGSAPIRPISGGAGVTTEYVRPSPTAARLLPGANCVVSAGQSTGRTAFRTRAQVLLQLLVDRSDQDITRFVILYRADRLKR